MLRSSPGCFWYVMIKWKGYLQFARRNIDSSVFVSTLECQTDRDPSVFAVEISRSCVRAHLGVTTLPNSLVDWMDLQQGWCHMLPVSMSCQSGAYWFQGGWYPKQPSPIHGLNCFTGRLQAMINLLYFCGTSSFVKDTLLQRFFSPVSHINIFVIYLFSWDKDMHQRFPCYEEEEASVRVHRGWQYMVCVWQEVQAASAEGTDVLVTYRRVSKTLTKAKLGGRMKFLSLIFGKW